ALMEGGHDPAEEVLHHRPFADQDVRVTGMPGLRRNPSGVSCRPISSRLTWARYQTLPPGMPEVGFIGNGAAPVGLRCSSIGLKLSGLTICTVPRAMPYCVNGNVSNLIATGSPTCT